MIAVTGVAVAAMAMLIVMSVFNGFQSLIAELFTGFDPELCITPANGNVMDLSNKRILSIANSKDVAVFTPVFEGQALMVSGDTQKVVTLKGVDDNYTQQSGILDALYGEGEPVLHTDDTEYCIPGLQLCNQLGLPLSFERPLEIYAPRHGERVNMANPMSSFNCDKLYASGLVFSVSQPKYDSEYLLCSLDFAQRLFDQKGQATRIEIRLSPQGNRKNIEALLGNSFKVRDRYEQQEDVFKIMQVEKFISYAFLCFIMLVACLNIMGSLSMLMIEKSNDMRTLSALGTTSRQIRNIFAIEGLMIIFGGAIIGLLMGLVLCLLQQHLGLIRMGQNGSFIVDAYPVVMRYTDLLIILVTVILLGFICVIWATRNRIANPGK